MTSFIFWALFLWGGVKLYEAHSGKPPKASKPPKPQRDWVGLGIRIGNRLLK